MSVILITKLAITGRPMLPFEAHPTLALFGMTTHFAWYLLGAAAGLLSLVLLYLMLSRRGETRAVTKCVVLSIWAHFIFFGFAHLTNWLTVPLGNELVAPTREVTVTWIPEDVNEDPSPTEHPNQSEAMQVAEVSPLPSADLLAPNEGEPVEADPLPPVEPDDDPALDDRPLDDGPVTTNVPVDNDLAVEGRTDVEDASEPTSSDVPQSMEMAEAVDAEQILDESAYDTAPSNPSERVDDRSINRRAEENRPLELERPRDALEPIDSEPLDSPETIKPRRRLPTHTVSQSRRTQLPRMYRGRLQRRASKPGQVDPDASVARALKWLESAQSPDGRWDHQRWQGGREIRQFANAESTVRADTAVTGLALLAFLGSGHTHDAGEFPETVDAGLKFLMESQAASGSLAGNASTFAAMYCHGIATLALSEAFIMTRDERLRKPLQRAIDFTLATQHPTTGGWRYQYGDRGDTSQFGWQVMALVSAETAGIYVPNKSWTGAKRWLRSVSMGPSGGLACYVPERRAASPSMTAEAMVCRVFLRDGLHPATTDEAATFIARFALRQDSVRDLYFCYYASLALYQIQDPRWRQLNQILTNGLVSSQRKEGDVAGSWDPNTKWGPTGGRVYTTAMAALCLETSYRYLPVYELAAQPRRVRR